MLLMAMPLIAMQQPITFSQWPWQHWAIQDPDVIAVFDQGMPITWRQLCDDICSVQNLLPTFTSSYIAINSRNQYQTLVIMLAAWQQGLTTLMLNPAFSRQERQEILQEAGIENLIEPAQIKRANHKVKRAAFDQNARLTLTLTSGSTGTPKAVVHSAKNHLASASGLFSILPFEKSHVWLLSLPLFHVSGLAIIWRWLAKGAALKIANIKGDALHTALNGVTHASLVPTQLQGLLQKSKSKHLHSVLLGGAQIPQSLVDEAERQGIHCWCGYGMTEMASTITAKRADGHFSVGKTLPFRQLKLSASGEVFVSGETLSAGYLVAGKIMALSRKCDYLNENNDWFATKDVGHFQRENESAELQLQGRMDNMFICGGEKVQPEAVERKLSGYHGISQLIILPVSDEKWGQVPVALIEGAVEIPTFLHWAKSQLPNYQCPKWAITLPDTLDHGGIKLSRVKLAAWLNAQIERSSS